ncbi:hypothetical protein [Limnohabitans sp. Rim8]|uniref:hypothetical protein n=1 Tax=Limnohabitans sp. Rim8 TaxID=1100718 RepID=UPI0025CD8C2F|nr:hypothetical protein [Limnohabitans sp. Rim8]
MGFEVIGNRKQFDEAVHTLIQKPASNALWTFLNGNDIKFIVNIVDGPSEFGALLNGGLYHPTIMWNPQKDLAIFGRNRPEQQIQKSWRTVDGVPVRVETLKWVSKGDPKDEILPPYICLAHEMGHAKQYAENPALFTSLGTSESISNIEAIEAENLVMHEWPICLEHNFKVRVNYQDFRSR